MVLRSVGLGVNAYSWDVRAWRASGGVWREVLELLLFGHEKAARFGGYDIQKYQLTICKLETLPAFFHLYTVQRQSRL